jgi:hypothetical protein
MPGGFESLSHHLRHLCQPNYALSAVEGLALSAVEGLALSAVEGLALSAVEGYL